jgi:hypothetical protein
MAVLVVSTPTQKVVLCILEMPRGVCNGRSCLPVLLQSPGRQCVCRPNRSWDDRGQALEGGWCQQHQRLLAETVGAKEFLAQENAVHVRRRQVLKLLRMCACANLLEHVASNCDDACARVPAQEPDRVRELLSYLRLQSWTSHATSHCSCPLSFWRSPRRITMRKWATDLPSRVMVRPVSRMLSGPRNDCQSHAPVSNSARISRPRLGTMWCSISRTKSSRSVVHVKTPLVPCKNSLLIDSPWSYFFMQGRGGSLEFAAPWPC